MCAETVNSLVEYMDHPDVYGAVIFIGPSENLARIGFLAIMSTSGRRSHA